MKKLYFFAALMILQTTAPAQNDGPSLQWSNHLNGIAQTNNTVVKSVRDNSGYTYVLTSDNNDMVTVKYDNSGAVIKTFRYNNTYNGYDEPRDLAVDNAGNVYMAGRSFVNYILSPAIVKFDASGNLITASVIPCVFYTNSVINTIHCTNTGGVYFAGAKSDSLFFGYLDAAGSVAWEKTYAPPTYGIGEAFDMTVDGFGFGHCTGQIKNASGDFDAIVFRTNAAGAIQWTKYMAGMAGGDDRGKKIVTDISSNSFVLSEIADLGVNNHSITLSKYNASGGFQWTNTQPYAGQTDAQAVDIRLDVPGNAYVIGDVYTSTSTCFGHFIKFNPTSGFDFSQDFDLPAANMDHLTDITVNNSGEYYVCSWSEMGANEVHVIKNSSTGSINWNYTYNVSDNFEKSASIHLDNSNNVYVSTHHGTANVNTSLIRVDQSGNLDWDGVFDEYGNPGDGAIKLFNNGNNSVYTLGYLYNSYSSNDVVVSKHDTYGNLMWQYLENSSNHDEPKDFTHDDDFNVYMLYKSGTLGYVRKLDSIGSPVGSYNFTRSYEKMMLSGSDFYLAGSSDISSHDEFPVTKISASLVGMPAYTYTPATVSGTKTYLTSMDLDGGNRIYGFGELRKDEFLPTYEKKLLVQKMNASGGLAWKKTIHDLDSTNANPYTTMAKKILVDGGNDVYLLGQSSTPAYTHAFSFVIKLDNNGNQVWRKEFNNSDNNHEYAADMLLSSGSTLVTLTHGTQGLIIRRLDRNDGSVIWEQVFSDLPGGYEGACIREKLGYLYALGTVFNTSTLRDYVLVKYDTSGSRQWYTSYTGDETGNDYPADMAITANDRIYISGSVVMNSGDITDFSLIKLCDFVSPVISTNDALTNICPGSMVSLVCTGTPVAGSVYEWMPGGDTNDTVSVSAAGNYYCTVSKADGCSKNTEPVEITVKAAPAQPHICMVTVDSLSTHNILYWDKTGYTDVDHFLVYREDVTNLYTPIGLVEYDSLSEFHDYTSNPNVTTKRYKISAVDSCGNESELSPYHNTLYCTEVGAGQFFWNLYDIEDEPNPVVNYIILRQDDTTSAWHAIDSTAGTQQTLNDPDFALFPLGSWRVITAWSIGCEPTRAGVSTSRSNIRTHINGIIIDGVNEQETVAAQVQLYPNPTEHLLTIETTGGEKISRLRVTNTIGQTMAAAEVQAGRTQLNVQNWERGIYHMEIVTEAGQRIYKPFVKL